MQIESSLPPARPSASSLLLGFSLAGFFDGILLHQILQWHHLLSLVPGEAVRDPRVQIAADGLFHALMYVLALLGVFLLWRERRQQRATDGRRFLAGFLIGFGVWQAVDAVVFHWLLRLHHIRIDVANPIAWDVGWLVAFGLIPLSIAWALHPRGAAPGARGAGSGALSLLLVGLVAGAGALSMRPAGETSNTVVLMRPGLGPQATMAAIAAVDGRLVEINAAGDLAVVALPDRAATWRLYRHGAVLVGGAGPAGCAASMSPRTPA